MRLEPHLIVDRKAPASPILAYNRNQPTFAQYLSQAVVANAASSPVTQRVSQPASIKRQRLLHL